MIITITINQSEEIKMDNYGTLSILFLATKTVRHPAAGRRYRVTPFAGSARVVGCLRAYLIG